jgi:DNA-binding transcriptional regulator YiaG
MPSGVYKRKSPSERLLSSYVVDDATGCWNWTLQKDRKGYGRIGVGGSPQGAHRLSYELHCGAIPEGEHVLHRCDNPACINPEHLFTGTNAENMADRNAKGRQQRGSKHGKAKLVESDVLAIRAATGMPRNALAKQYGISVSTIKAIRAGRHWAHIDPMTWVGRR